MTSFDPAGSSQNKRGYVFESETPPALQSAISVAMAALPGIAMTVAHAEHPRVRDALSDLTKAVHGFALDMKGLRQPPENVLIALKTIIRRLGAQHPHDPATAEELQRIVVLAAVKSYFDHWQASAEVTEADELPTNLDSRPLILVVDDDDDARFIAKSYLTAFGYTVVVAGDGREVLNIARRVKPTLIVLDIVMPTLDGRAVVQMLKNDPATRPIPVIAVTGLLEIAESPELVAHGFADVLLKPVRQHELLRAIDQALRARGDEQSAPGGA